MPRVVSTTSIWTMLILLLAIHLGTNYLAVRAVSMRTLNRQRANILLSVLADSHKLLDPVAVSKKERVFEHDGVLRWHTGQRLGFCRIGISFGEFLAHVKRAISVSSVSTSRSWSDVEVEPLLHSFAKERYILWFDTSTKLAMIVLKEGASTRDKLKAWAHALLVAKSMSEAEKQERSPNSAAEAYPSAQAMINKLEESLSSITELLARYEQGILALGFDMDVDAIQVRPGTRIAMA